MRPFKLIIPLLSILSIFVGLNSCTPYKENHQGEDAITIGLSFGPSGGRWKKDRDYLQENLIAQGAKVIIKEANDDISQQVKDLQFLLNEKVDVVVVVPIDGRALTEKVKELRYEGVKIIAYDRIIRDCEIDFYISFDNLSVGEIQAEYLTRIIPKGKYIILDGPDSDPNSNFVRLGQMNILQPLITKGDIQLIYESAVNNWSSEKAFDIMDEYLSKNNPRPDAILASSDKLSTGAIKALEKYNLAGKIVVSGQDAEESACQRILNGTQIMTVYKFIGSLANTTAKVAIDLAKGKEIPNTHLTVNNGKMMVPSILLPSMIAVNKENLRMTVIADGYLDEAAVYGQ